MATTALAENEAGPIVLNNDDVARIHGEQSATHGPGGDAARREPALAETTATPSAEELAEALALEADLRARLDRISHRSMGSVEKALEARNFSNTTSPMRTPGTSRPRPLTSMPAAPLPRGLDADDPATGGTDADASESAGAPTPACIYGPQGHLLFEPKGRSCDPVRKSSTRPIPTIGRSKPAAEPKDGSVGCVYGSRGQLLYESRGVECAAEEPRD